MESAECGQSLAPEWLLFGRELPLSSQDKSPTKQHNNDRDRPGRRFGKQHSYHHLTHISPSSSHSYALQSSSASNWRHSDPNPRILNRSKSSPVFDSKENAEAPASKSPDRSNVSSVIVERHIGPLHPRQKSKIKGKPPLMSSRSQPNLFTLDKAPWQQAKFRSPPPSRVPSLLSNSTLVSSPSSSPSPIPSPVLVPVSTAAASPPVYPTASAPVVVPDDLDLEMEKLRILVPAPSVASAPKPPTRLVSNRKGSHPNPKPPGRPEKPATPPPNIHFRKAASETSLLNNPNGGPNGDDMARKLRAMKVEKKAKVALKETLEEQEVVVAKRNNFLMDVFKREKQMQDSSGEEVDNNNVPDGAENFTSPLSISEAGNANHDSDGETNCSLPEDVPLAQNHNDLAQSQQLPTVEDEERFLRLLGWVPEEEDHVPELEEDEIAEVRLKLNGQQQVLCK